jgi:outer membrane receptor for ferrienterochelin and colicins
MQAVIRHKIILFLVLSMLVLPKGLHAQSAEFSGSVVSEDGPLEYACIIFKDIQVGGITNAEGIFEVLNVPAGTHWVQISSTGYVSFSDSITFREGQSVQRHFRLKPDLLNLSQTVVTGTRNRVERYNSPVIVNTIDAAVFELTQSINVADGLNFSPGLRVENNCQNCGFTQLRMNGLDGPYSQILINSRPIFSALAGVYGLEMLPANMVDRIEVVRGGGSVMYGGNAIAGTVNILTKNPVKNTFDAGINQSLIYGETSDRTINFNGSVVSEDLKKGISFFGFNRNRDNWDANGDGFSEMVALRNNTFGFDAFYALNDQSTIKLGTYYINEFRRGGNKFDLFPHQTDITEQLEHDILSTNLGYEYLSKNNRHKLNVYASLQHVNRMSYYGGGGRVLGQGDTLTPDDILAINAYGSSTDLSTITGLQYNVFLNPKITVLLGAEYVYNDVLDEMPGYGRVIDQQVGTLGSFAELEIKPTSKLTFLVGGRFDHLNIQGNYNLAEERFTNEKNLNVFVPRMTALYNMKENLKLRASFAQGYRGPQAFDEDLHIETVGGAARFIRINPNLEVERSNSAVLSLNYDKYLGKNQMNFVLEGFYTRLTNPFIFADQQELPSGVAVITKRNGDGATVSGINLEANYAFSSKLILQSGATLQTGVYDVEEELWAPDDPSENTQTTTTRRLLRTPNAYGYYSLVYNPTKAMTFSYSGVLTGTMDVPHVIDAETERTVLKSTPVFFENNIKVGYAFQTSGDYKVEVFGGVQNLLNSYQEDFDLGANRDAGYVYGPIRPRTFFMGLKFGLE